MILNVKSSSILQGKVQLPASKSFSIRAFIIAAFGGRSLIINPSDCNDSKVSMQIVRALGYKVIRKKENSWEVSPSKSSRMPDVLNVKESGTVLRFLLPFLSLRGKSVRVVGEGTLRGRPNLFLTQALRSMGSEIKGTGKNESIPVVISGGELSGGKVRIDGSISSQFISALLITCPQMQKDTHLLLKGRELVSADYITMTRQILKKAGVNIRSKGFKEFFIKGNQVFKGLKSFVVPSDYGLAAFLMAAAVLTDSNVVLQGGLNDDLVQADGHILKLLKKMGVKFKKTSKSITVKGPFNLKGGVFSLKDCPDLVPIMAVLALFAKGTTRLCNIKHARAKESDRISDLRRELLKVGAKIDETADALVIHPQSDYKSNCLLDPHNDHRLAMSFSVFGLKVGVRVKDIECSSKSYPGFVRDLKLLGAKICKEKKGAKG